MTQLIIHFQGMKQEQREKIIKLLWDIYFGRVKLTNFTRPEPTMLMLEYLELKSEVQ